MGKGFGMMLNPAFKIFSKGCVVNKGCIISILLRPCLGNPRDAKMRQCPVRKKRRGTGPLGQKKKGNRDLGSKKEEESWVDSNRSLQRRWRLVGGYSTGPIRNQLFCLLRDLVDCPLSWMIGFKLDKTVWAEELLAQKHERIFIHLWDNLRAASAKHKILARFPFNRIIIGKPDPTETLEQGSLPHSLFRIKRNSLS